MIFLMGVLAAGLLILFGLPSFWARALRLSRRRLEAQLPISLPEIIADRDLLRAEQAVKICQLHQELASSLEEKAQLIHERQGWREEIRQKEDDLRQAAEKGKNLEAEIERLSQDLSASYETCETLRQSAQEQTQIVLHLQKRCEDLESFIPTCENLKAQLEMQTVLISLAKTRALVQPLPEETAEREEHAPSLLEGRLNPQAFVRLREAVSTVATQLIALYQKK